MVHTRRRWIVGTVLATAVLAVPCVGLARSHFAGRLPTRWAPSPTAVRAVTPSAGVTSVAHHKAAKHAKAKHAAPKRSHKRKA